MEKTTELLNEDLYWSIVEESLQYGSNKQEAFLVHKIGQLTLDEMIGFKLRTNKLLDDSYTSEMWCAAYLINGGCSDDGFDYFRAWLISRGKSVFYMAKENPDSLVNEVSEDEEYEFETFLSVADEAFKRTSQKDIDNYIDFQKLAENDTENHDINFNWDEENPDSMKRICPQLFDKFWN